MTDTLTNEGLKEICSSTFELANYAMDLARYYIRSGHQTTLKEVLRDVKRNPDPHYVDDLKAADEAEMQESHKHER